MRRRIPAALFLAAALPAAADNLNYNIIHFSEEASVSVENDTLNAVLLIRASEKNHTAAAALVSKKLHGVSAKIRAASGVVMKENTRSSHPEYGENGRIRAWSDSAEIRLSSTHFPALLNLLNEVKQDAAVESLYYSVSPQKRAAAVEEASQKSLAAFRQRAGQISKTMGFDGYKIVEINIHQSFSRQEERRFAAPEAALAGAAYAKAPVYADTAPGEGEVRQTVSGKIQMY